MIDRRSGLARETSGNPAAAIMPRLTAGAALDGRFYAAPLRFAGNVFDDLSSAFQHDTCGLLQLATTPAETERQGIIAARGPLSQPVLTQIDAAAASDIAGVTLKHGGLYFPQSGWLEPAALCAVLADDAHTLFGAEVAKLVHEQGFWRIYNQEGRVILEADIVVLANALGAQGLPQTSWLPLEARRGQVTFAPPTAHSAALRSVLSYGGSITPVVHGLHSIGATFETVDAADGSTDVRTTDHAHNLSVLENAVPGLMAGIITDSLTGRAAVRCASPDHLPIVGPLPVYESFLKNFAELRHGHPWTSYPNAEYLPGLYTLTGLGSHGAVSAPLAAELLASHIAGESWPVERDLMAALHPARFLVRDLKRRET